MRTFVIAAAALLASAPLLAGATAALAAPAAVSVTIAPDLQDKAAKIYGVRDVNELADRLQTRVAKRLARTGAYSNTKIELVLNDAQPNRPTFKQLGDKPGLSYDSFGIGGAEITGQAIAADGAVTPISYRYYESDIRYSRIGGTWADAEGTFDRFAYDLARGKGLTRR